MTFLHAVSDKLALKDENGKYASWVINEDIRPMPPHRRTWTGWTYFGYQSSVGIIIVTWGAGASLLGLGLNAWQSIIVAMLGYACVGILTMVGSQIGGKWHIPFPVASRFAWGIRGYAFPALNRVVLDTVWWSTESWLGMMCVQATIGSIWPSFYNIKNTFPDSVPMTTAEFVAWFIFVLLAAAGVMLRPERFHWPGIVIAATNFITVLALVGWFSHKAGGVGILFKSTETLTGVPPASGSAFGWAFVHGLTTMISSQATGLLGFADWGRYAKHPGAQRWPQGLGMALSDMFSAILGIICASCCATIYPDSGLVWNQALLLTAIQKHEAPAARAAVFFASVPILLAQLFITVTGSSIAAGIDLSGLVPKYLNLRRAGIVVVIVGICMQPWQLANTNTKFIAVMNSYAVFLAPLTGILHCEYYLIRKQRISLKDLYTPNPSSSYWFTHGIALRTVAAFAIGFTFFLPGYIHNITPSIKVSQGWTNLFNLAYPVGYFGTGFLHYVISYFFPPKDLGKVDEYDEFGTFAIDEKTPFGMVPGGHPDIIEGSTHTSDNEVHLPKEAKETEKNMV